jgi:hypothetical protein
MRFVLVSAVLLGLISVAPAREDSSPKKANAAPTLAQLLAQLKSRDADKADAAEKALVGLGGSALPDLQKVRETADPELRRRLDELIPLLERSNMLTPKRVNLHMTNKTLQQVMAELTKQTGYKMEVGMNGGPQDKTLYTFHFDKLTFWEAIDKVCDASGMVLNQWWGGDDAMHFWPSDSYVPYNVTHGPFKVMATGFNYNRNNNFGQLPKNAFELNHNRSESLNLNLMLAVEPKLPIIKVGNTRLIVAEDDEHNSMIPPPEANNNGMYQRGYYWWGNQRMYIMNSSATLHWASKTAKTLKTLKGVVPVTVLADQKPAVVTDKLLTAKGKKFKVGSATFQITEINEQPGKQYQISLTVTEDVKDNPNDWSRIQSLQQRIEVQDDRGNRHNFYLNITSWNSNSSATCQLNIQPPGPKTGNPVRLVYYSWNLLEHDVAFEFKDLPLP